MSKKKIATIWMDGCSGCHMSFLDIDHRLLDLADLIEIVHSPIVDHKDFPPDVDVTLVEGAVSSDEDYEKILKVRARTKILVAMGDCAVSANVPAMRNRFTPKALQEAVYLAPNMANPQLPHGTVPILLPRVRPVHEVVKVDVFVPGCPPSNDTLFYVLSELIHGRMPDLSDRTRFGA
ncbi:MAG: NADP oxidoreductase [Aggregatilineales bacterium]